MDLRRLTRTYDKKVLELGAENVRKDSAQEAEDSLMPNLAINLIKFQHKSDGDDVLTIDDLDPTPTEMEDIHPEV
ncbi:hypothetical protein L3X38_040672 [Prunus dulcis]|uniref:Uncharacterized protein n=1 Tax=Prunus dulcis TaxID=3755 RepID=A0AAD4YTQ5_PRUDU|nr:hypothetical protein L3X38_040672 [Prunus dulcis]